MAEQVYLGDRLAALFDNKEAMAALNLVRNDLHAGVVSMESAADALSPFLGELPTEPPKEPVTGIFEHLVQGENDSAFSLVELLVNAIRGKEEREVHHFGLWGPASTGKTTTAQIIAKHLERPIFVGDAAYFNGHGTDRLLNAVYHAHFGSNPSKEQCRTVLTNYFETPMLNRLVTLLAPTVIFIDEAHELDFRFQNALLTVMEQPFRFQARDREVDCRDLTIILATTDSSQLLKPLRSRCHNIEFEAYSPQTVAEIVQRS